MARHPPDDPIVAWVLRSGTIIDVEPEPPLFGADEKPLGTLVLETAPAGSRWFNRAAGFLSDEHSALLNTAFASGERRVEAPGFVWVFNDDGTGTQTHAGVPSPIVQLIPG